MEYIITIIGCIITILILTYVFEFDIKKIKKISENKELNEIANRFPKNEEICKSILKKINNEKVKIKQNEDSKDKTSLYIAITDTILIADIKDTYTRIQTIAHECIHSIQSRKILLFNFYFTNIYIIYFILSCILTITGVFKNYSLQLIVLLIMGFLQYAIRSYLENDAMIKARYLAKEYMEEYIKENPICNIEEVEKIYKEYDEINKIGIPAYNLLLFRKCIIKVGIYSVMALIMLLIK